MPEFPKDGGLNHTIRKQLPESSGSTYCFDEQEVINITNRLIREHDEFLEQFIQSI